MVISDFAKLSAPDQMFVLRKDGLCFDTFAEKGKLVRIYYLEGYFVEVTSDPSKKNSFEITPYKKGYFKSSK